MRFLALNLVHPTGERVVPRGTQWALVASDLQ